MAWQLIYTSAPRGVASGQSGFCTVARSAELREAVALRLEQISSYHYLHLPGTGASAPNPTISAYRILDLRGAKYHVLTRIQPCGLDFTARTNHLAQHLVFQPEELARLPSPAAILRHWNGWLSSWAGNPGLLKSLTTEDFRQVPGPSWPAKGWQQSTGDAGRAAGLLESENVRGCYLLVPERGEQLLLELIGETLQLLNFSGKYPLRPWHYTFTTFLQAEDAPSDFQWRGCQEHTPAWEQARRRSVTFMPIQAIRVPNNPLVRIARQGPPSPSPPAAGAGTGGPLKLQRESERQERQPAPASDLSAPCGQRTNRSGGRTGGRSIEISISLPTLLKAIIGLAVVALLVWGINHKHPALWGARTGPLQPGTDDSNIIPAPAIAPTKAEVSLSSKDTESKTPGEPPVQPTAPVSAQQLSKELDAVFAGLSAYRNVCTYLIVVPGLRSNVISVSDLGPLEHVLEQLGTYQLYKKNIELRCERDNWCPQSDEAMRVSVQPSNFELVGEAAEDGQLKDARISFTGVDFPSNPLLRRSVRVHITTAPLQALSVVCQPAETGTNVQAFRLLVVSGNDPPRRLELSAHFLNHNSPNYPDIFKEPLRERLGLFQLVAAAQWQLRPRVRREDGKSDIDVLENWPGNKQREPRLGGRVDLASIRSSFEQEVNERANEVARLDKRIAETTKGIQAEPDWGLPLGRWFEVQSPNLANFGQYQSEQPRSSDLYLKYLLDLAMNTAPDHWVRSWSAPRPSDEQTIVPGLNALHDLCTTHVKKYSTRFTFQDGRTTNYFLAVWESLKRQETRRKLEQQRAKANNQIHELKGRLKLIPSRFDELAGLSLCIAGPRGEPLGQKGKPLEMIRFTNGAAGKRP